MGEMDYEIQYKKVKNITLRITTEGKLLITAPKRVSKQRIEQFIQQKQGWIVAHQQQMIQLQQKRQQQGLHNLYCNGGQVAYLGRMYPLQVCAEGKRSWQWNGATLQLSGCVTEVHCRQMVEAFYRQQLLQEIIPALDARVRQQLASLHLPEPEFTVRKMRASWGLCYSKTHKIILNLWLAMAPEDCIHQVLVHEYLHFCESNHGSRFYALLEQFEPEYRQIKQRLSVLVDLRNL